jgi:2-polyprenyl-6-hydroxyphenyl methylase/3-demethylubiquinone-9 3-methyltransferase
MSQTSFEQELSRGERFRFGDNWKQFLLLLNESRIVQAEAALRAMLEVTELNGLRFLDIGSGSGLSSLAARRLGATVFSFDYDPSSAWCTRELRRRYLPDETLWTVEQGSVLDSAYLATVPDADIVYSWGVLHHTGHMYDAIRNAARKVRPGGRFYLALYRKTVFCQLWKLEKRIFSSAPAPVRSALRAAWIGKTRVAQKLKGRNFDEMVRGYGESVTLGGRGMDYYRDVDDWLGGYPYESILPRECREFVQGLGFTLVKEKIVGEGVSIASSSGCDEWVFRRIH